MGHLRETDKAGTADATGAQFHNKNFTAPYYQRGAAQRGAEYHHDDAAQPQEVEKLSGIGTNRYVIVE